MSEDMKKILVVDDEEAICQLVKMNLEDTERFEVHYVTKGTEALSAAKAFKPDLVLLDFVMPDKEGSEVKCELEDDSELYKIPIVFLTAIVTKEEVDQQYGLIAGNTFIAKPIEVDELIRVIDSLIQ